METTKNHYLNVREVARLFGVTSQTVRGWANRNILPATKTGKSWFFSKSKIYEIQGLQDASRIFPQGDVFDGSEFDVLVGQSRIEVKTAPLQERKNKTFSHKVWSFKINGMEKSDYYLMFGYSEDRSRLIKVFLIPTYMVYRLVNKRFSYSRKTTILSGHLTISLGSNIYRKFELVGFKSPFEGIICIKCNKSLEPVEEQSALKKILETGICWSCQIKADQDRLLGATNLLSNN